MSETYYDSELTAEQIEDALKAIADVVNPGNNGKIMFIEDGKIKAASASRWSGTVLEPLSVTANGDYTPPTGTDGFDSVHVAVPSATLTTKSITQNGTYNASSDNADGYSSVTVDVQGGGSAVVQPLSVTQNGTYNPPSGVDGYAPVTVNVSGGSKRLPDLYGELSTLVTRKRSFSSSNTISVQLAVGDIITIKYSADAFQSNVILPLGFSTTFPATSTSLRGNVGLGSNQKRIFCAYGSICDADDQSVISDGSVVSYGGQVTSGIVTQRVKILRLDQSGPVKLMYGFYNSDEFTQDGVQIYEMLCERNGNLIADVIPCIKNDGTIGSYELISNIFTPISFGGGKFV